MILVAIGVPFRHSERGVELWCQKRREKGALDDKWEFPGGKIGPGEEPLDALKRELWEETQEHVVSAREFAIYPYHYPDRSVTLYVYLVRGDHWSNEKGKWLLVDEWPHQNIMPANQQMLSQLKEYFAGVVTDGD